MSQRAVLVILEMLADGAVTLMTVALLRPHLTANNHSALITAACDKSKREVEEQIARLAPRPDAKPLVRRMPAATVTSASLVPTRSTKLDLAAGQTNEPAERSTPRPPASAPVRAVVAPLAPERYLLKVTVSGDTHAKLRRAQDLLRHAMPNGDPAAVLDRALTLLVEQLERTKAAATTRSRPSRRESLSPSRTGSRHIPAAVKREVWTRDGGRCAFEGPHGRCTETGRLEFHHVVPFASGGPTRVENLALRCRAHNGFEGEEWFGPRTASSGERSTPAIQQ